MRLTNGLESAMQETEPGSRSAPRVLKIAPTPFFGDRGCHVRILEELRALERRGYEVTVCTYPVGGDPAGVDVRRSLATPWIHSLPIGPSLHKFYLDPLLTWTVVRTCMRVRPQILHGHLHGTGSSAGSKAGSWVCPMRYWSAPPAFSRTSRMRWVASVCRCV